MAPAARDAGGPPDKDRLYMDVSVKPDGDGRYIVSCPNQMEWPAREDLLDAVVHAAEGDSLTGVILDLDGVTYISSAALGGIFLLRKHVLSRGGRIVAARPSRGIDRLLKTVNMEALMPVTASVADARDQLTGPVDADAD